MQSQHQDRSDVLHKNSSHEKNLKTEHQSAYHNYPPANSYSPERDFLNYKCEDPKFSMEPFKINYGGSRSPSKPKYFLSANRTRNTVSPKKNLSPPLVSDAKRGFNTVVESLSQVKLSLNKIVSEFRLKENGCGSYKRHELHSGSQCGKKEVDFNENMKHSAKPYYLYREEYECVKNTENSQVADQLTHRKRDIAKNSDKPYTLVTKSPTKSDYHSDCQLVIAKIENSYTKDLNKLKAELESKNLENEKLRIELAKGLSNHRHFIKESPNDIIAQYDRVIENLRRKNEVGIRKLNETDQLV